MEEGGGEILSSARALLSLRRRRRPAPRRTAQTPAHLPNHTQLSLTPTPPLSLTRFAPMEKSMAVSFALSLSRMKRVVFGPSSLPS